MNTDELSRKIQAAKTRLLQMHFDAKVGHIGGNLSVLDCLMTLFHDFLSPHVILSKGHAAGALYITLWSHGQISEEELKTFHQNATHLSGHPTSHWHPMIPFATGSLGHGLPLAAGIALAKKLRGDETPTFCITSDGEWQEGSTWEALIFAKHQKLNQLKVFIDKNGLQGFGTTEEVASLQNIASRLRGFEVQVLEINGHSPEEIRQAAALCTEHPLFVVMNTVKGKGVSFMENQMQWHYLPMTPEQFKQAVREVTHS